MTTTIVTPENSTERVFLTLLGHSDSTGFLGRFSREETLDFARVTPSEYERALAELEAAGRIKIDSTSARRKFYLLDTRGRPAAHRYIREQRPRVESLVRERERLSKVRASGWDQVTLLDIVREETANKKVRWRFAVEIPEIGVIHDCSFYEASRRLYGPSRFKGAESETLFEFRGQLENQVTDAIRRHIDATFGSV